MAGWWRPQPHGFKDVYAPADDDPSITRFEPRANKHLTERGMPGQFGPYVPLTSMRSRAPKAHRSAYRTEPLWSGMWNGPATAAWAQRREITRLIQDGRMHRSTVDPALLKPPQPHSLFSPSAPNGLLRARMVAATMMWRTLTTEQLAAFTGDPDATGHRGDYLPKRVKNLIAADLLQYGVLARLLDPVPALVRRTDMPRWDSQSRYLSFGDWLSVTAGRRVADGGARFERHAVMLNELSLRAAEFTDLQAVLGESLCKVGEFMPVESTRTADALWVRRDGFQIAIEMTTGLNANVDEKVDAWAKALAADPTRGTAVVFVCARQNTAKDRIVPRVQSAIARAATASMDRMTAKVAQRMFYVDWSDWFPRGGLVSSRFPSLPVFALNKHVTSPTDSDLWRTLRIGDPTATPWAPATKEHAEQVAHQMLAFNQLWGQPYWMRDHLLAAELNRRLDLWTIRKAAGLTQPVSMPFARPDRYGDGQAVVPPEIAYARWHPGPVDVQKVESRRRRTAG